MLSSSPERMFRPPRAAQPAASPATTGEWPTVRWVEPPSSRLPRAPPTPRPNTSTTVDLATLSEVWVRHVSDCWVTKSIASHLSAVQQNMLCHAATARLCFWHGEDLRGVIHTYMSYVMGHRRSLYLYLSLWYSADAIVQSNLQKH